MTRRKRITKNSAPGFELLDARQMLTANLLSLEPANLATQVDGTADLTLNFSDDVVADAGAITIRNADDGSVLETIAANDASRVTINGKQVTVDPANALPINAKLSVTVDDNAFRSSNAAFFLEDFEGVELREFESPTESGGDGTDWTDELPEGWDRDNTTTPEGEPVEFFGFNIFDKDAWVETAGDQSRSQFTRGQGNVVVADGDEYDDGTDIDPDQMNVFLMTPVLSLDGYDASSVKLEFDSSFYPYDTMTATVDASYDGGDWESILTMNAASLGGNSDTSRRDTVELLSLNNTANGNVQVRFGLLEAGNDWWWAFDNVALKGPVEDGALVAGITDESAWTFETAAGLSPANGATAVAVNGNLEITFSQDVKLTPGAGNIEIRRGADDSVFEIIPASEGRATANGHTVTIDPVNDLEPNTEYYVLIDEFTIYDTADVDGPGITIFSEDFESLPLQDSPLVGGNDTNDYVVVMSGVLDVKVAGEYTFGGNSDDGQLLAIDFSGDGLDDPIGDAIIYDGATHGAQDRLTTCDEGLSSCVGEGFQLAELENLEVGQYEFQFWYFERNGGSGGEFFYAPGYHEEFSPDDFVLVGDDSQGIGVTAEGITATTYKSAVEDATLDLINSLERAEELVIFGDIPQAEGFPVSEIIELADVHDSGSSGRFTVNNPLPGVEKPEGDPDWSPDAPEGWTRESTVEDLGATPEFNGWTFLSKDFWIAQQGNQARDTFTKGQNVLAVSDPDAIDDFIEIGGDGQEEPGIYDGWLATPPISLANVEADKVSLIFDSSFRPYPTMVGKVDVSFDEGDNWETLLTLDESTVEGGVSSLSRANATETLEVANPGEGTVMFRWVMEDAGNDWWWAVDNIRVNTSFKGNPLSGISDSNAWRFTTGDGSAVTLDGDIDGNGQVDFADFLRLSAAFGSNVDPGTPEDIDGDGSVGFSDFLLLSGNFGKTLNDVSADVAAALVAEAADTGGNGAEEDLFGGL